MLIVYFQRIFGLAILVFLLFGKRPLEISKTIKGWGKEENTSKNVAPVQHIHRSGNGYDLLFLDRTVMQ